MALLKFKITIDTVNIITWAATIHILAITRWDSLIRPRALHIIFPLLDRACHRSLFRRLLRLPFDVGSV